MILRKMLARDWILATLVVILAAGIFVRLGFWQLDRLEQRRNFNAGYTARRALGPLELPSGQDLQSMEYRSVIARGVYDFDDQVALRNQYHEGELGYHLLTPLTLSDGQSVLVDRGWIPALGNSEPVDWRLYDQSGEVTIRGVLRLGQASPQLADPAAADPAVDFWTVVDLDRLQAQIPEPLLPVYVQLDPDVGRTGPPIAPPNQLVLTEGPHLGYALQWFGFAAASLAGYVLHVQRQESRNQA